MRNEREGAVAEGDDVMLQIFQGEAVDVDKVAGDMKFGVLAVAVAQVVAAGGQAGQQQQAVLERLALANDNAVRSNGDDFGPAAS